MILAFVLCICFLVIEVHEPSQVVSQTLKMNLCFAPKDLRDRAAIGKLRPSARGWGEGSSGASLNPQAAPEESSRNCQEGQEFSSCSFLGWIMTWGPWRRGNRPHLHQNTSNTKNWFLQEASYVFFSSRILIKIPALPYPISFRKIGFHLPASCLTKLHL